MNDELLSESWVWSGALIRMNYEPSWMASRGDEKNIKHTANTLNRASQLSWRREATRCVRNERDKKQ